MFIFVILCDILLPSGVINDDDDDCPTRAKQLGDLWTAAPTILDVNFLANFAAVVR